VQEAIDAPEEELGPVGQLSAALNASRQSSGRQRASIAVMGTSSAIYSGKPQQEKPVISTPAGGQRKVGVGVPQRRASTSSIRSGKPVIRNYALGDT
jgi:hypothetical protein